MKKINFGIVGLGRLGRAHAENLAFLKFQMLIF